MQTSVMATTKSFWDKPEGKTGKVVIGLGVLAVGYMLMIGLPILIALLSNLLYAGVLAGIVFAVACLLANKQFRTSMTTLFQLAMRQLTGWVVTIDPIGVIKDYLKKLEVKLEMLATNRGELRGQIKQLENKQGENIAKIEHHLRLANAAKGKDEAVIALNTRQAGRLTDSNKQYEASLMKMRQLDKVLEKMHKASKFVLEDMTNDVEVKEREYESIKRAHAAFKSAMSILSGDQDERAMYEASLEFVAQDLGNKVGEIERFLEDSSAFMSGIDIENDVFSKQGDDLLNKWLQDGSASLSAPAIAVEYNHGQKIDLGNSSVTSKYLNLKTPVTVK